jgi:hypothetical protein
MKKKIHCQPQNELKPICWRNYFNIKIPYNVLDHTNKIFKNSYKILNVWVEHHRQHNYL